MSNYYGNQIPNPNMNMNMGVNNNIHPSMNPNMNLNLGGNMNYNTGMYNNFGQQRFQQQPVLPPQKILEVNGRDSMEMLNMSPNSSILGVDKNQPLVWLAETDDAGYKTITAFKITPITNTNEVNVDLQQMIMTLEQRISKLEGVVNDGESSVKPNATKRKPKSTNESTTATTV